MTSSFKVLLLLMTFFSFNLFTLNAYEFQVGDKDGWKVPPSNDTKVYNEWASKNRFKIGDTIHFRYKKDSVMQVNEADYKACDSTRPMLFSNTGNTVYKLDRSGPFYFISGTTGHCQLGQRMIIKVVSNDEKSKKSNGQTLFVGSSVAVVVSLVVATTIFTSYLF